MAHILIVDDEEKLCNVLKEYLEEGGDYVQATTSGVSALNLIKKYDFDIVITDLKMTPIDGIKVLEEVKRLNPDVEVVMITAYSSVETAVDAMKKGAYDYIKKPFSLEEMGLLINRIKEKQRLLVQNKALKSEIERVNPYEIVGDSLHIKEVISLIAKIANKDVPILITGETGTGKELIARNIHRESERSGRPFIAVNCASIPENLLESELFGYERGAFTGADRKKPGLMELADGGTLLLDEIGDLPLHMQAKLLRVIEEKNLMRLGGTRPTSIDVRTIAATNKNLQREVKEGKFREDLFFRLSVFPIHILPLRDRKEDIIPLAEHFLKLKGYEKKLSTGVIDKLKAYDWPGNVRELFNVLERALILSGDSDIEEKHLQITNVSDIKLEEKSEDTSITQVEIDMIKTALERSGGNKSKAAKLLGITRRMLYTRLKKYGLE